MTERTELRDLVVLGKAPLAKGLSRAEYLDVDRNSGTTNVFPGGLIELAELFMLWGADFAVMGSNGREAAFLSI